jgi:tRNA 2-thiouridine synthesizing protein A
MLPSAQHDGDCAGLSDKELRSMQFDKDLDARGLSCPLPILRAKKALAEMTSGQVLRIVATDPGSVKDFAAFAKQTGNELLKSAELDGKEFEFFLKRR